MKAFHENREAPNNFYTWLKKRYAKHKKGDEDTVIVVCGGEQLGKSRWTLRTIWCLKDEQPYIENIVFTGKDYRDKMRLLDRDIIHDDEAGTHLFSREAMVEDNKLTVKRLQVCGYKHNMHFLCLPSFFSTDPYIRDHRVRAVVKIYKGCKFKVWCREKKIKKILKQKNFKVRPSSLGWWSDKETTPEFQKFMRAYRKREDFYKNKNLENEPEEEQQKLVDEKEIKKEIAYNLYKDGFTQGDIASSLKVTRRTILNWIKSIRKSERDTDI